MNPSMTFTIEEKLIWCEMRSWKLSVTFHVSLSIIWDFSSSFPNLSVSLTTQLIVINIALLTELFCWFVIPHCLFFNWDSLHARLNSHYKAWSYKKKKHKKKLAYRKSVQKDPIVKICLLILDLKIVSTTFLLVCF